jgi:DNA-binding response OmpR family regulator
MPHHAGDGANVRGDGNRSRANGPGGFAPTALVCTCGGDNDAVVCRTLREEGYEVVACPDRDTTLSCAINDPPDVILYSITPHCPIDRGVLQTLRRSLPRTPLVIVASEGSLETQKLIQEFRPVYYAVAPVERAELVEAVKAAMAQRGRLALGNP